MTVDQLGAAALAVAVAVAGLVGAAWYVAHQIDRGTTLPAPPQRKRGAR